MLRPRAPLCALAQPIAMDDQCIQPTPEHNDPWHISFIIIRQGSPSRPAADEMLTRRLREALALIDVRVLDHFVVSAGEVVSLAERGLI